MFDGGLVYGAIDGRELLLDVLGSEVSSGGLKPLVVCVHGGGWHEGDRGSAMHPWLNPLLASHGFVTASLTYRLSGEARWPAPLDDVRGALAWLREHAQDPGADPESAASPVCQVRPGAPPFLLAHGSDDRVVPIEGGERLRDALAAAGAEARWVPVAGAGHEWADRPASRGLGESEGSFGSVALPFFDQYLKQPH